MHGRNKVEKGVVDLILADGYIKSPIHRRPSHTLKMQCSANRLILDMTYQALIYGYSMHTFWKSFNKISICYIRKQSHQLVK